MSKYIYLSHFINENTPLYGGKNDIKILKDSSIAQGDTSNTSFLNFPSHTGTHIDFPKHFSNAGKTINDFLPKFWLFNIPFVINYNAAADEIITIDEKIDRIPQDIDFLIIKTGFQKFREDEKYWRNNPGLDPYLAAKLKKTCPNLRAIGFDFISISSFSNRKSGRISHKKFLIENDILIIEDMNLIKVNDNIKKIICLPLMIDNIDGSPVTIIGEINE